MEIEKKTVKHDDGSYEETYHKKGDKYYWHREDGPARIMYDKYGSIYYEEYRINNKLHREDGPSRIVYNKDGSICYEEYRINGRSLSKEDWEDQYGWKLRIKDTPMGEIFLTQN